MSQITRDDEPEAEADAAPAIASRVANRAMAEIVRLAAAPARPGLYLVATPIGNLGDITLRALAVLASADVIYCEDTRHSRVLTAHFAVTAPLRPYHEHNAEAQRPRILAEIAAGKSVALISDAGTPLVSDPGYKLVRDCLAEGHAVEALPGPSAALAALSVSGLPSDTFLFVGFLPPRSAARKARLMELSRVEATLIVYEAPQRLAESLADMHAVLGARPAAVARELTKLHEATERDSLANLAAWAACRDVKGEIAIVVAPPTALAADDAAVEASLQTALRAMSLRDAAKAVSEAHAIPKARAYEMGLRLLKEREPDGDPPEAP